MKISHSRMFYLSRSALFAALIFLGTYLIRIPIPSGYIHFGDGFIYAAAAILPPAYSMAAAAVGGVLSDVLAGYALYAPWTAVIKALAALPAALLCRKHGLEVMMLRVDGKRNPQGILPLLLIVLLSGIVQIGGYFLADLFLYSLPMALAGIPMNAVQSLAGIAIFLLAAPLIRRSAK